VPGRQVAVIAPLGQHALDCPVTGAPHADPPTGGPVLSAVLLAEIDEDHPTPASPTRRVAGRVGACSGHPFFRPLPSCPVPPGRQQTGCARPLCGGPTTPGGRDARDQLGVIAFMLGPVAAGEFARCRRHQPARQLGPGGSRAPVARPGASDRAARPGLDATLQPPGPHPGRDGRSKRPRLGESTKMRRCGVNVINI
jgi:hypothetical protein